MLRVSPISSSSSTSMLLLLLLVLPSHVLAQLSSAHSADGKFVVDSRYRPGFNKQFSTFGVAISAPGPYIFTAGKTVNIRVDFRNCRKTVRDYPKVCFCWPVDDSFAANMPGDADQYCPNAGSDWAYFCSNTKPEVAASVKQTYKYASTNGAITGAPPPDDLSFNLEFDWKDKQGAVYSTTRFIDGIYLSQLPAGADKTAIPSFFEYDVANSKYKFTWVKLSDPLPTFKVESFYVENKPLDAKFQGVRLEFSQCARIDYSGMLYMGNAAQNDPFPPPQIYNFEPDTEHGCDNECDVCNLDD